MKFDPPSYWESIKGFLSADEGAALYRYALSAPPAHPQSPVLEIGSYCGKSAVCLGLACRARGAVLFAVDHHRGSEEHQQGEEYHDPELYDQEAGRMDSFREFRRNVERAGIADTVVPIVAASELAARAWATPLAMVFIDGGHSLDAAMRDYRGWAKFVLPGGILAIHDVEPDPAKGGQAPYIIYQKALDSGRFEDIEKIGTLAILQRKAPR